AKVQRLMHQRLGAGVRKDSFLGERDQLERYERSKLLTRGDEAAQRPQLGVRIHVGKHAQRERAVGQSCAKHAQGAVAHVLYRVLTLEGPRSPESLLNRA